MLEKELKVMLTQDQYDRLSPLFSWNETREQINFYYAPEATAVPEDPESIPTIRIRSRAGKLKLQVKLPPKQDTGAIKYREEYEGPITYIPHSISSEMLQDVCPSLDIPKVSIAGMLYTYRLLSTEYPGVEICLDKNEYLGKTDYELELEFAEKMPDELLGKLAFLNIDMSKVPQGKYTRFMKAR